MTPLDQLAARHQATSAPGLLDECEWCSELWPCDTRRILDIVGERLQLAEDGLAGQRELIAMLAAELKVRR